ncbi:trigger factor [Humibacter ginsenosidimutans]|uniref:Trigger factor n=1 Tax=Humibacter ginsenosidimutans TaxID=2599293 RepID=A0A5B8LZS3_9MICO|nr:trigger factor [Humibacter ginsenosidimutans]QDZ14018.1 trigger factor [Humibacter ginsenosidimutans]
MKTTVEKLSPTRAKLTIAVTPEELQPSIKHAYEHIAQDVNIPGFRKGKVPPPIIDQRVGKAAVLEHAVNEGLEGFYRTAVEENDVKPVGRPEADITEWPSDKDFSGDLLVAIEVDVRPEITVPDYDGLELTVEAAEVTDADVEAELDRLRSRFGTLVTVDRPAKKGDFAQLDLVAAIGDEQVDTASNVSYEVGSGELVEGIDEALDSLSAGETTTFTSKLLGGDHEGEDAEITVTLTAVKERELPDADDDFAQISSEFDTIAELRESLRGEAARGKTFAQGNEARNLLVDRLLELTEIPVPSGLVEDEVHRHLEAEERLEDDVHRAEVTEATEKAFRTQVLFDEIAQKENIQVTQDELSNYLVQAAAQYGMDPNEFVQALGESGQLQQTFGEVARNKTIAVVLGRAVVKDGNGEVVDLSEFAAVSEPDEAEATAEDDETAEPAATDEAEASEEKPKKKASKSAKA